MTILSIQIYDGLWSAHPCVARHCHEGTTLLTFLLWNKLGEGENSVFLVFNIVVIVYCCPCRQEVNKCNTSLILWFFFLATSIEFFIDCILSVAAWILVQMVVPFFILSDNWQQEAITSYIILVEKIFCMRISTFGAPNKHWPWNSLAVQYLPLHCFYQ